MRLLGLDPGLQTTGWGVIELQAGRLVHIADGKLETDSQAELGARLVAIYDGLAEVLASYAPASAAVEETFVNKNPASTLKLGQARGVALLAPARQGLSVAEYAPTAVKKAVVGVGHASKEQIRAMLSVLLPGVVPQGPDSADALAVAICHGHHLAGGPAAAARGGAA